jgi:uncharacterized protein
VIENTFIHLQGIGQKTERELWRQGIYTWQNFLSLNGTVISCKKDPLVRLQLEDSINNFGNIKYFADRLPASDSWRMFDDFKAKAAYLDIETSGDYSNKDLITVIGLYDGTKVHTFVNGQNLQDFEMAVESFDLLITFNGSCFDLPVIKRCFPNISLPAGHIDLRFLLSQLGYKGGLKKIERELGIGRDVSIEGLSGLEAIKLWEAYTWGNQEALDLLIRYNTADIINLKPIMEDGYKMMKKSIMSFQGN